MGFEVTIILNRCMKHIHHIIPKHMGGSDEPSNLIELSVEEHALAHKKLYEKYGKQEDFMAWHMLSGQIDKDDALFMARSIGGKKKMSEESKQKLRESCAKRTERQRADGTLERANKKRSEAMRGKKKTPEAIENWRKSRKGYKHSPETIAKIKAKRALQKNVKGIIQNDKE